MAARRGVCGLSVANPLDAQTCVFAGDRGNFGTHEHFDAFTVEVHGETLAKPHGVERTLADEDDVFDA